MNTKSHAGGVARKVILVHTRLPYAGTTRIRFQGSSLVNRTLSHRLPQLYVPIPYGMIALMSIILSGVR